MAKSKAPLKKKAQEKKVSPPPSESFSSELDEDEAENSQPLANSTTRGIPVALDKTVGINKIADLAEEDSEEEDTEEETGGPESEEAQPRNGVNLKKRQAARSRSKRAGLVFPVARINRQLKQGGYSDRIGESNTDS